MGNDPLFEDDSTSEMEPASKRPWRPQFGMGAIMLMMFLFSMLFVMGHYMLNTGNEKDNTHNFPFLFLTLATPVLLLTVLSIGRELMRLWEKAMRDRDRH